MTAVILRRRKLGKGSATGIIGASKQGITQIRNWVDKWPPNVKYVFRWGCTSDVPGGDRIIINETKAVHWCSDKRKGRLDMQDAGVPVPKTYEKPEQVSNDDADSGIVIRPARHAQGRHLYVTHGHAALVAKVKQLGYKTGEYYLSQLIPKVAEYRVFVCQGAVVWVAKKTPGNPEDVAWNVARGGRFDNVRWDAWPMKVIKAAILAADVSGTDFSGVDVMEDADGKPYVLEVNSAPSQTSPYRQQCVAKAFDYIIANGKEKIELHEGPRNYRDVIHPALLVGGE